MRGSTDRSGMPKGQGHSGGRVGRSTSKTTKDKRNNATLRASQRVTHRDQSGMGDVSNHMRRCHSEKDSEKDSGYSEAGSISANTDVDDQRSSVSEPHNNNNHVNATGLRMPPFEEMTPVYVIKNLVVKPSGPEQLLSWGGGWHSLANAKAATQLLLIQQPTMPTPPSSTQTPSGPVEKGGSHSSKNSYLPILNSYPRIAPHPRKESLEAKSATWVGEVKDSEGQSQSKRVCIEEEKREAVASYSHLLKPLQQHYKEGRVHSHLQSKGRGGPSSFPSHATTTTEHKSHHRQQGSDSVGAPSISFPSHATTTTQHKSHHRQHGSDSMGAPSISFPSHATTTTQHKSHHRQHGSDSMGAPSISFPSHATTTTQHKSHHRQHGSDSMGAPSISFPSHAPSTTQHKSHHHQQGSDSIGSSSISFPSHASSTNQHKSHHRQQSSDSVGSSSISFPSHATTTTTQHKSHHHQQGSDSVGAPSISFPSHASTTTQHKSHHHQQGSDSVGAPSISFPSHAPSTTHHKSHHCQKGSDSVGSPSVSSSQIPSPPSSSLPSSSPSFSAAHSPHCLGPDSLSTHHQRFLNTAEVLNQSGLLAITLRTKELLKQNATTEREIAQLRQHTDFLCQVAQANQNGCNKGSESLDELLLAMTETGCYPDLDVNHLNALSSSSTGGERDIEKDMGSTKTHSNTALVGSVHNTDEETSPPSPLFAPSPDSEQRDPLLDPFLYPMSFLFPQFCP